jgi:rod shape-determining protein MreC
MRTDRAPGARRLWVALIFLVLGTVAGVWHNRRVDSGKPDYIAGSVRFIVSVPARAFRGVSGWIGNQTEWIGRGRRLAAENRDLRDRVAVLEGENNQLKEAQIDLDRLRSDLGFAGAPQRKYIAADIMDMKPDPKFDTMVIGRSASDGIKPDSVVVTRDGVVGRVSEVDPGSSVVLMLTDQKSGVGARIQRSRAFAVCEGDNSSTLSMLGLPNTADVRVGDVVVTSGLGGVFPGGLLLGTVSEVRHDAANGGMIVRVKPQVAFDKLEQVYVIP